MNPKVQYNDTDSALSRWFHCIGMRKSEFVFTYLLSQFNIQNSVESNRNSENPDQFEVFF